MAKNNPFEKFLGEEDHTHRGLITYIKVCYPNFSRYVAHPPNEGMRSAFQRFKITWLGVSPGLPDILFFFPMHGYHGLALEVKSKKGKATENQLTWLANLATCGWRTEIVNDMGQGQKIIDEYFKPRK